MPCNHSELISPDKSSENLTVTEYVAFNLEAHKVPAEVFGDDCTAMRFWKHFKGVVGRGGSPDSAVKDLLKNLKK